MRAWLDTVLRRSDKRSWIIAGCGLVVLSLGIHEMIGKNGYLDRRRQRQQVRTLEVEIQKLQQENQRLTQRVEDLRSDPHAVEELAREQLRMGRPGEVVLTLPSRSDSSAPAGGNAIP